MFNAPFIIFNGSFYLPENLAADLCDRVSEFSDSSGSVPSCNLFQYLRCHIRFHSASCLQDVGDTEHSGVQEASPDLGFIITGKRRTGNAVDDIFEALVYIAGSTFQGDHFQSVAETAHIREIICAVEHAVDGIRMLIFHLPDFHRTGVQQFAGISHIKDIAQLCPVIRRRDQRDSLSSAPDIPMHGVIPNFVAGTGRSFGTLRVYQQLIVKRIFIKSCGMTKKLHP